jgi:hypothetical protein
MRVDTARNKEQVMRNQTPPVAGRKPTKQHDGPAGKANGRNSRTNGVQGEGDYAAARRYQHDTDRFIESGKVDGAARRARPRTAGESNDLQRAEDVGRARSRGEDPHDEFAARETPRARRPRSH